MAHIALLPFGSAGDVFPFIWLGRHLKARGHRVTVITACLFTEAIQAAGLDARPIGDPEKLEQLIADPRLWRIYAGTKLVFEHAGESTEPYLQHLEAMTQTSARPDLTLAPCTVFGARLAREHLGIPLLTVHVQPAALVSAHEPPILLPGMEHLRRLPLWLRRWLLRLPNPADRFATPAVNQACRARNVQPPRRLWWDWANSPDGVLALFPAWFGAPQPDWPQPWMQGDFPLEDLAQEQPLDNELLSFLASGEPPIVFTPGSANVQAQHFFTVALEAVQRLNKRALFVTRHRDQLPGNLPSQILPVAYAPFSSLLPHAAAFVHHGGIGTLSQGFAAGVPQLLMPMAHDQPDNAHRLHQLGAGLALSPGRFTPDRVTTALHQLLTDPAIHAASQACAHRLKNRPSLDSLLNWIEQRLPSNR